MVYLNECIEMKKPIIGFTLDVEKPGGYSKFDWYAIRKNYLDAIEQLGGIAFPLSHNLKNIESSVSIIDGLIITGGNFSISPSLYGEKTSRFSKNQKNERTIFEYKICKKSLKKNIPVLGICGGEQLLNVYFGGTLIQNIKTTFPNALNHEQRKPRNKTSHSVLINKSSKLYKIIKQDHIKVNSAHYQSVNIPGKNIIVSGKSDDGIIESIENNDYKWCIGVQWHPEFLITKADKLILKNFIYCANNI